MASTPAALQLVIWAEFHERESLLPPVRPSGLLGDPVQRRPEVTLGIQVVQLVEVGCDLARPRR